MSRRFPKEYDYMLLLRYSKGRKANTERVIISDNTPESDCDGLSDGRIYTMAAFPPVIGHAVVINNHLCTCESMYMDVSDSMMASAVSDLRVNSLKWLVGADPDNTFPTVVKPGTIMQLASEVYINNGPLCLYDNHAVVESTNHSPNNTFWHSLYPPQESVKGVIISIRMSKLGHHTAVTYVALKELSVGDKLGTAHGIKFTVGEILPYADMAAIIDNTTQREFKPNLLISTKNLTWGLGGQIREMTVATSVFESIETFRTKETARSRDPSVMSFQNQKTNLPKLPSGDVVVNGKKLNHQRARGLDGVDQGNVRDSAGDAPLVQGQENLRA